MNLSKTAIEICRRKRGIDALNGFEPAEGGSIEDLTESEAENILDELTRSEMITATDDSYHLSPLGHHILGMMAKPEIFVMLENKPLQVAVRMYIRRAYYLCVVEETSTQAKREHKGLTVVLLPTLKEVVGSFAYALHRDDITELVASLYGPSTSHDIRIVGKAWDKDGHVSSTVTIKGDYFNKMIKYRAEEKTSGEMAVTDEPNAEASTLVNLLTKWLFDRISEVLAREEVNTNVIREH